MSDFLKIFRLLLAIFLSFCSQFCEFCSQFVNFSSFFHQNSTIFMSFKEVRKVRARTPQNPHISITLVQRSVANIVSSLNISAFFFYEMFYCIQCTIYSSPMQESAAIIVKSLNISAFFFSK